MMQRATLARCSRWRLPHGRDVYLRAHEGVHAAA
jgi:hypothetical protein